jgi:RNA polymerase sigma-70 factor, ECF subfamily
MNTGDQEAMLAAARAGDESAFAALVEPHRRELRVHCYRMLGSFDESEDLVQDTFLRAWKAIGGFAGRSTVRAWLYRIATNACLDALDSRARRVLPHQVKKSSAGNEIAWLQPFPDRLWEPAGPSEAEPERVAVSRETIELAFLVAIQQLPPRQRAALILRDVLGFTASQTANVLEGSVASVNSALQRARATLRQHLPERRLDWAPPADATERERAVLRRYMDAVEQADLAAVAELLAADVRATMPPYLEWYADRDGVLAALAASWDPASPDFVGRFHMVPTRANGRPAAAAYVRLHDDEEYRAFAISVLRVDGGRIAEMTAFHDTHLFRAFGLPMSFSAPDRLNVADHEHDGGT